MPSAWISSLIPACSACGPIIPEICSNNSGSTIAVLFNVICERSILLMSRISLMRLSRWLDETDIFFRQSATFSLSSRCAVASVVIPMIAFIGVRISWLMAERKSLFARFAFLASTRAFSRASFVSRSVASISVTSARTMHTVLWFSSPHSTLTCLYRRSPSLQYGNTKSYPAGLSSSRLSIVSKLNCFFTSSFSSSSP